MVQIGAVDRWTGLRPEEGPPGFDDTAPAGPPIDEQAWQEKYGETWMEMFCDGGNWGNPTGWYRIWINLCIEPACSTSDPKVEWERTHPAKTCPSCGHLTPSPEPGWHSTDGEPWWEAHYEE
jgi:hypothetical protein